MNDIAYRIEDFQHYIVGPIDSWASLHYLSSIRNREGGFARVGDDFIQEIVGICNECKQELGWLRHEPLLAFEPLLPDKQPRISQIYLKEDENGVTHIFSTTPLDLEEADSSPWRR